MSYLETAKEIASKTKSNRIIRFFPDSDLRCSHYGLCETAKVRAGMDPKKLKPGEFMVFANRSLTGLKIFAPGNLLVYLKHPDGHKIDLNVVRYLPKYFNGTEFNFKAAMFEAIAKKAA